MAKHIEYDGKHLTLSQRLLIEKGLNDNKKLIEIATIIQKDPRAISREIKNHRLFKENFKHMQGKKLHTPCKKTIKFPFVCNGCSKKRSCILDFYTYNAEDSHKQYKEILVESRVGINLTGKEFDHLNGLIKNGVDKGQSIHHIVETNKEDISVKERTVYRYIEQSLLSTKNIDLRRKVALKKRVVSKSITKIKSNRDGRLYSDYINYLAENPGSFICQMDTVVGLISDKKVLLTIHFPHLAFTLAYLLESKICQEVYNVFNYLQDTLGINVFQRLFPIILCDRGTEFDQPMNLELDSINGEIRTRIFYCDSYCAYQKGAIERNHELIRYILPKNCSFESLTQDKVNLMMSHINSYVRESLGNKSPYDLFAVFYGHDILNKLKIRAINPENVTLKPQLLK